MTIDDQLRDIARHADQHQQVITAQEVIERASIQGHMPVQFTEDDATMLDLDAPVPTETHQTGRRGGLVTGLLAAAAVVAIAVVATRDDDATPADQPSTTVAVSPTVPPQALPNKRGPIAPGTYYVDEVDGTPTPRIIATIGAGWRDLCDQCEGWGIAKRVPNPDDGMPFDETTFDAYLQRDVGGMSFSHPDAVYSDACHWDAGNHPGPVDTVDGLVTALIEQRGWADVSAPSDISIDGYVGKAFQRTAPADMSNCDTRVYATRTSNGVGEYPDFRSWEIRGDFNAQYEPGLIETLWVLDLDGTMVIISTAASPEPSAGAPADFAADVLDSIHIEQPSPTLTVTVPPTVPPQALPNNFGPLEPGTYYVDDVSGTPTPRIFATIGTGWWGGCDECEGWRLGKQDTDTDFDEMTVDEIQIGSVEFSQPAAVFLDPCHMNDLSYHRGPVTTLDGLVAALTEQQGWADVTTPTDISIDGYAGKAFQRTAPADISDCDTMPSNMPRYSPRVRRGSAPYPIFVSWLSEPALELDRFSGSGPYEPGEIETLWVIDIDGALVVISTRALPEPSAGAPADFAADVLDSISIERP